MSLKRYAAICCFALLLAAALLAGAYRSAQAAPPAPIDIPLTQPDGTQVTGRQWGDEWQHGMETRDGYSIVQAPDGYWVYAAADAGGNLSPVMVDGRALVAGRDTPPSQSLHARPSAGVGPQVNAPPSSGSAALLTPNTGSQPLLLVLVEFANVRHTYPATTFQTSFFGASNSIVDYYKTASFGKLTLTPPAESYGTANDGVIGWLHMAANFSNSLSWTDIAYFALEAADPYIDYAAYDKDGNGYVTSAELHTVIVVAGYELSYCGSICSGVWAHQSSLPDLYLDDVYLASDSPDGKPGGYAMFGEIHGAEPYYPDHPATIGVMVHELGHDLSWPDLYDTNDEIGGAWSGVGRWSIMGSGSWNAVYGQTEDGGTPALPDAWLKAYQGWISPEVAANGQSYDLESADSSASALQLGDNPGGIDWNFYQHSGTGEYWLVENRQKNGYDAGLPGCGILIWHVNETVTPFNTANGNPDKPLLALEEADGRGDLLKGYSRGDGGDAYPGYTYNRLFGNMTNPSSRYQNNHFSDNTLSIVTTSCSSTMQVQYAVDHITMNSRVYLPLIGSLNRSKPFTGRVTYAGTPWAGVPLNMAYSTDSGNTWDMTYASATTNSQGYFSFDIPPAVGGSNGFIVYFDNPNNNPNYLWYFECKLVSSDSASYTCNFDIQDVVLYTPADGASVSPAVNFSWTRRSQTTDDYYWRFYNAYNASTFYMEMEYAYSVLINFCSFPTGYWNRWWIDVSTPSGYGIGYDNHRFSFSSMQFCAEGRPGALEKMQQNLGGAIADAPLLTWMLKEGKMSLPGTEIVSPNK